MDYNPAAKPVFTAPGAYSIEYRSTDNAGNVEAIKTIAFTITAPNNDHLAPVTTGTLDPCDARCGPDVRRARDREVLGHRPGSGRHGAPANFNVNASGTAWDPSTLNLTNGDRVTWNFPADDHFPHDVWVIPPGGNPRPGSPDRVQVSPIVNPGSPSVSRTFTTNGAWTFYCSLHASLRRAAVGGMAGTINVDRRPPRPDAPTGVDFTEYRVKTGATQGDWVRTANTGGASPFASQVTISAEGQHTVEYRSVDKAGNAEAAKTRRVRHRHPGPGLPGHPGLRRPDLGHRAAAGPLLRHRVRSRRRAADLQVGVRQRRLLRPRRRAHVHPAGDVHRQGDGDRRRGRQDLAGGHGHGPRAGRRAADGRRPPPSVTTLPAGSSVAVQRRGHRPGRPGGQPARTRGTSATAAARSSRTRATSTCCRAPTPPRSR